MSRQRRELVARHGAKLPPGQDELQSAAEDVEWERGLVGLIAGVGC